MRAGQYFLIHFPDWIANGTPHRKQTTNISVARVPIFDLLRCAFAGHRQSLPPFRKFYKGEWNQAGINGLSSDTMDPSTHYAGAPQVVYSSYLKEYIAILDDTTHISYSRSPDGISWSPAVLLKSGPVIDYATPVSTGDNPNIVGPTFYVYYTASPKGSADSNRTASHRIDGRDTCQATSARSSQSRTTAAFIRQTQATRRGETRRTKAHSSDQRCRSRHSLMLGNATSLNQLGDVTSLNQSVSVLNRLLP